MNVFADDHGMNATPGSTRLAVPEPDNRHDETNANHLDYRALFIGDQAENGPIFKEIME